MNNAAPFLSVRTLPNQAHGTGFKQNQCLAKANVEDLCFGGVKIAQISGKLAEDPQVPALILPSHSDVSWQVP